MRITTVADFGNTIRELRHDRGLTQAQLADLVGVSREWVSRVESGKRPEAEAALILRAIYALGAVVAVTRQQSSLEGDLLQQALNQPPDLP